MLREIKGTICDINKIKTESKINIFREERHPDQYRVAAQKADHNASLSFRLFWLKNKDENLFLIYIRTFNELKWEISCFCPLICDLSFI